jgi:hypothetical protein
MPGSIGESRREDIVPNGPIVPLANMTLPNSINLSTYRTYGSASVLSVYCTGTFSISTITTPTTGAPYPGSTQIYIPGNRDDTIYFSGNGTLYATLFTTRSSEV